jgi:hypothetical protein
MKSFKIVIKREITEQFKMATHQLMEDNKRLNYL